jgi:hypothetical protein
MGEGALEWSVADAATLPILDPRRLPAAEILRAFTPLARRPIGDVFAEAEMPDRRALDRALGDADLVDAVTAGLLATVSDRLRRSQALG